MVVDSSSLRSAAGLSLRALERRIGGRVTAQAIGKYERNESMPGSGVLIALAKALGVSVEYLTSAQDLALEAVEFRKKPIASRREETIVQARVIDLLSGISRLRICCRCRAWSGTAS